MSSKVAAWDLSYPISLRGKITRVPDPLRSIDPCIQPPVPVPLRSTDPRIQPPPPHHGHPLMQVLEAPRNIDEPPYCIPCVVQVLSQQLLLAHQRLERSAVHKLLDEEEALGGRGFGAFVAAAVPDELDDVSVNIGRGIRP